MRSVLAKGAAFLRWLLTADDLDRSVPLRDDGPSPTRAGFVRRLLQPDELATDASADDAASTRPRGGLLRFLFAPETLPAEPDVEARIAPPRRGLWHFLFVPEALPATPDAETSRRTAGVGVRWLFAGERLDGSATERSSDEGHDGGPSAG